MKKILLIFAVLLIAGAGFGQTKVNKLFKEFSKYGDESAGLHVDNLKIDISWGGEQGQKVGDIQSFGMQRGGSKRF